jgi:outer membrane lipoprotein-sorting protein
VPEDRQVIESEFRLDRSQTPLLFLFGKGTVEDDFFVYFEEREKPLVEGNILLRLVPKLPQAEFSYVLLELTPDEFQIHRLAVIEPIGQRNDYVLNNFKSNVKIPRGRFRFKVPKGTEVIRQD